MPKVITSRRCWQQEVLADGQGVSAVQQEVLADGLGVLADQQVLLVDGQGVSAVQQEVLADGLGVPAGQQGEEKLTTTAAAIEDESECSRLLRTRNRVGCYDLSHRKKAAQQIIGRSTAAGRQVPGVHGSAGREPA